MTDKQIIIDVNKCKYRDTYTNFCKAEKDDIGECYTICTGNDCYYKQLQREKQNSQEARDTSIKEFNRAEELKTLLQRKEQECEELKEDKFALELRLDELTSPVNVEDCEHSVFNGEYIACRYYEGQRCDDADFANCMYRENIRLKQQLDQLKAELEQEKALKETYLTCYKAKHEDISGELFKLKQTLTEIKPILELYANSTMGEEHPDRTYHINLSGGYIMVYDSKPARQALQKISEVENGCI